MASEQPYNKKPYKTNNPHIVLFSQKVHDIVPKGSEILEQAVAKLRATLVQNNCIRPETEKAPSFIKPLSVDNGNLTIAISELQSVTGEPLKDIVHCTLPLGLPSTVDLADIRRALSASSGVAINDGGNIQNTAINLVHAIIHSKIRNRMKRTMGGDIHITCASSSDPFDKTPELWGAEGDVYGYRQLDMPDRTALQLYGRDTDIDPNGKPHALSLTSPSSRTGVAISDLVANSNRFRREMLQATDFLSADPVFDQIRQFGSPPYSMTVNSSSAFRAEVVRTSYSQGVMLPMNRGEAVERVHSIHKDGDLKSAEMAQHYFPSPFQDGSVNAENLCRVDRSLCALRNYNPFVRMMDRFALSESISYASEGGLLIGARQTASDIACFTTIPSEEAGEKMLDRYCDRSKLVDTTFEVGAGDATASIVQLFKAVDPQLYLGKCLSSEELKNSCLVDLSSLVFVSILSRMVGKFLIHTKQTNWSSIMKDGAFEKLFQNAAKEAAHVARKLLVKGHISDTPHTTKSPTSEIDVLVWRVSRLHHNDSSPECVSVE